MNNTDSPNQEPTLSEPHNSHNSERMEKDELASLETDFTTMQRAIRGWAVTIIVLNIIDLAVSGYPAYHLVLVILAITTLVFRSNLMMIIISAYVVTEGVTQLLLGAELGLFFVFSAFYIIGSLVLYFHYNKIERSYREARKVSDSGQLTWKDIGRRFSIVALALGIIGFCSSFTTVILASLLGIDQAPLVITFYLTLLELAGLGLGFGIAAFAAGTPLRWPAMAGIIIGLLIWFWEMASAVYWE